MEEDMSLLDLFKNIPVIPTEKSVFKKRSYEIPNLPLEIKFKASILTSFFLATIGETIESELVCANEPNTRKKQNKKLIFFI